MSDKVVDWNRPIEAYHEDGRVCPAEVSHAGIGDARWVHADEMPHDGTWYFEKTGNSFQGWRIRNVEPQEPPLCEHTLRRVLEVLPDPYTLNPHSVVAAIGECRKAIEQLMPKSPLTAILSAITSEDEAMDHNYAEGFHEALRRLHDKGLLREVGE